MEFDGLSLRIKGPIMWNTLSTDVKEDPISDNFVARLNTAQSK